MFLNVLAILLLSTVAKAQVTIMSCGGTLQTTFVSINPSPVCIGSNICYNLSGQLTSPITSGATVEVTAKAPGQVVIGNPQDLCTILASQGKTCPYQGPLTTTVCGTVSSSTPPNSILSVKLRAINGNGGVIACYDASNIPAVAC